MILDWNAQCYKIHTTHKLKRDDPSDNKSVMSQEAHYIKYLLKKDRSYFEIYMFWSKIKNGTAKVFKDDPEQQVATFAKLFKACQGISDKVFEQHYTPVRIYKSEIRFLNNLYVPLWMKQYWATMLIYWKFASQHTKNVEINGTLCNWAMRHTCVKDPRFSLYQDKIALYNRSVDGYVMQTDIYKKKNSRKYWFNWAIEKSDEEFVEIFNLDKIKKVLKILSENVLVCPDCGKKFKASSKQKTKLCPECYKKARKQTIKANFNRYYHSKKCDCIEQK